MNRSIKAYYFVIPLLVLFSQLSADWSSSSSIKYSSIVSDLSINSVFDSRDSLDIYSGVLSKGMQVRALKSAYVSKQFYPSTRGLSGTLMFHSLEVTNEGRCVYKSQLDEVLKNIELPKRADIEQLNRLCSDYVAARNKGVVFHDKRVAYEDAVFDAVFEERKILAEQDSEFKGLTFPKQRTNSEIVCESVFNDDAGTFTSLGIPFVINEYGVLIGGENVVRKLHFRESNGLDSSEEGISREIDFVRLKEEDAARIFAEVLPETTYWLNVFDEDQMRYCNKAKEYTTDAELSRELAERSQRLIKMLEQMAAHLSSSIELSSYRDLFDLVLWINSAFTIQGNDVWTASFHPAIKGNPGRHFYSKAYR